jgi:hypothetical protein
MAEEALMCCANCSKAEELEAKLKTCNACKLVKYCGRDCQIAHRSSHRKACRKRAAELHDEALFKQPPKADDCPICFLPLPVLGSGKALMACCGKIICIGCRHEHELQSSGHPTCPFCRASVPNRKEGIEMMKKRADDNDSDAMCNLGMRYLDGDEFLSIKKDTDKAAKLFHRAAELGSSKGYTNLALMYYNGEGVSKDESKAKQYYEKGAMAGSVLSRFNLGIIEADAGRLDRAIKHWLIAANCGEIKAVDNIKKAMARGHATRALRGYQQWVNEVKSDQRDRAAAYSDEYKYV